MRLLLALLFVSTAALAQDRGTIPLGQSQDGAKPADGALIMPGEKGGVPDARPTTDQQQKRCMELSGMLREECLLNEKGASSGGTAAPDSQTGAPPRTAPPPQNPR